MLASTVKFSKYGRARRTGPRLPGVPGGSRGSRSGGPTLRADPSGPNSVPDSSMSPAEVPSPSTDEGGAGVLTAFRSTTSQVVDVH